MKILVVLPRFPYPLDKGDKLRAYHQIVELSKRHEIYLFALSHGKVRHDDYDHLRTCCMAVNYVELHWWESAWGVLKAFFTNKPLQLGYWSSRRARRAYTNWEQKIQPDVVYCQMVRTMPTLNTKHLTPNTKYVLDFQDALSLNTQRRMERSHGPLKWVLRYEYKALQRTEQKALRLFDATTIISQADREAISPNVAIVPNGVDTDYFKDERLKVKGERLKVKSERLKVKGETADADNNSQFSTLNSQFSICFTGNMSYAPNVDAALFLVKKIMPLVWSQYPSAKVLLAGADPKPAVRALAGPNVTVSGRLPDIREAYASTKVFVAPMRIGSGMQNKLLEAMAMHLPCVTTSIAATPLLTLHSPLPTLHSPLSTLHSPLPTLHSPLLIGNTPEELAKQLVMLLNSEERRISLAEDGHRFVQEHYSWPAAVQPLETILTTKH